METRIRFDWQAVGAITMDRGKVDFPTVPSRAGVWRVTAGGDAEYGASQNLRQLLYQMASPGPSQGTLRRVNSVVTAALADGNPARLDIVTSADRHVGSSRWERLDLERDEIRALVRAAAAAPAAANADPDADSAAYREVHEAARRALIPLSASELMKPLPAAKPPKPDNGEVRQLKQAAEALNALLAEHDRYWYTRWGHEGNPAA
jgi:hypothetical protein